MDTKALQAARQQVAELEAQMLEEVREKCALLGIDIGGAPVPRQKRTRRTKAQIAANNEAANG